MTTEAELEELIFARLVNELDYARERGLDRIDGTYRLTLLGGIEYDDNDQIPFIDGTHPTGKKTIPLLTALARDYADMRGHGQDRRWQKIRLLITEAIPLIQAGGRLRRLDVGRHMDNEYLINRVVALYGILDSGKIAGQIPLQLTHIVKEAHPYEDERTTSRYNRTARSHLADAIMYLFIQEIEAEEARAERDEYVSRPQQEGQFTSYLEDIVQRIVFVGFPGMGKTSLARACAGTLGEQTVPVIRIERGRIWTDDLRRAFVACNAVVPASLVGHENEYLVELLCGDKHPPFVILDNLESTDQLVKLAPPETRSRIIATSRARGELRLSGARFINVGRMDDLEAEQMIRDRLPRLSRRQVTYLASELEGFPLVIRYACRLLANQDVGLDEFCQGIKADAAEIARQARTEEGSTLLAVLRRLVTLVRQRDEFAYDLLAFISLVTATSTIDARVLRHYGEWAWKGEKLREPGTPYIPISPLRYAHAVAVLRDFGVIDQVLRTSPWTLMHQAETYTVHPLSQRMLRTLLQSERSHVTVTATTLVVALFKGLGARWSSLRRADKENEFSLVVLTVTEFLAHMLIDIAPRGQRASDFFAQYDWIEPGVAAMLLCTIASTLDGEPEVGGDYIPEHWYEWAKAAVYRHREFFGKKGKEASRRWSDIYRRLRPRGEL